MVERMSPEPRASDPARLYPRVCAQCGRLEDSAAGVETLSVLLKLRVTTDPEVRRVLLGR